MTGQDKSGGYRKMPTVTPQQKTLLDKLIENILPQLEQASQGFQQFLPQNNTENPITQAAMTRYQQQTIPAILGAFGGEHKGSSALNQALAASASNLNTDLAAQQYQQGLAASQGLANLGLNQAQLGTQQQFAYQQRQPSSGQNFLKAGLPVAGAIVGGIGGGVPTGGVGAVPGAIAGAQIGNSISGAF